MSKVKKLILKVGSYLFSIFPLAFVSSLIAMLISWLFLMVLSIPFFDAFKDVLGYIESDWYVNAFFTYKNQGKDAEEPDNNIYIIQIDDSATRQDVANIISQVSDMHPKVIGLDFYFPVKKDSFNNVSLKHALINCSQKTPIVVSSYYKDKDSVGAIQHSFFHNSIPNLPYGLVNHADFISLSTDYKGYPTFSAQVAKLAGVDVDTTHKMVINFTRKNFTTYSWKYFKLESQDTFASKLKDKIVLLGDINTPNDLKDLPFIVNGSTKQLSGVEIIAYEINSLLSIHSKNNNERPLKYSNWLINIVICILALLIYLYIIKATKVVKSFVAKRTKKVNILRRGRIGWLLFKCLLLPLSIVFIVIGCFFIITRIFFVIPKITLFVVAITFIEEIYEALPKIWPCLLLKDKQHKINN